MSSNNNNNKKEFNVTLSPFYHLTNGQLGSIVITPQMFDALQKVKVGGKLFFKPNRSKNEDSASSTPDYYLEYMTPERLNSFKKERQEAEAKDSL